MKTLLVVLGAVAGVALATPAYAQKAAPVRVTNTPLPVMGTVADADAGKFTHVGQKPSNIVNLNFADIGAGVAHHVDAFRLDPNTQQTLFEVPTGFIFILTDVQGSANCTAGAVIAFGVEHEFGAGHNRTTRDRTFAVCNSGDIADFNRSYGTGIIFGAGARLALGFTGPTSVIWGSAQGYLVPAN